MGTLLIVYGAVINGVIVVIVYESENKHSCQSSYPTCMESGALEHTYIQCIIDPPIPTLAAIYCPCDGSSCSVGIVCALLQQVLNTTVWKKTNVK